MKHTAPKKYKYMSKSRHDRVQRVLYLRDLLKREMLEEILQKLALPPLWESRRGGFDA